MDKENQSNAAGGGCGTTTTSSNKVIEMTKDLLSEPEEENDAIATPEGVDWNWGDADDDDENSENDEKTNSNDAGADDNEESDATAELSDGEEADDSRYPPSASENDAPTTEDAAAMEGGETANVPPPPAIVPPVKTKVVLYESSGEERDDAGTGMDVEDSDQEENGAAASPSKVENEENVEETIETNHQEDSSPAPTRRSSRVRQKPKHVESDEEEEQMSSYPLQNPRRKAAAKAHVERAPTETHEEDADADDEAEDRPPRPVLRVAESPNNKQTFGDEEQQQPSEDDLLHSTDYLFMEADKDAVTVADICRALCSEYGCKLSKASKKRVREHLIDLIKGTIQPQVAAEETKDTAANADSSEDEQDQVSEQGDQESEASEFERAGADSDEEYEESKTSSRKPKKSKTSKAGAAAPAARKQSKPKTDDKKRPSQRKGAKAARKLELERLRKKRMEELRIRNEEMQLNQSKEEQERHEAIAARFETNTDELRLKRLEDRLTLLELLDKKRIAVIDALESKIEAKNQAAQAALEAARKADAILVEEKEKEEESDESSSDEEELDIVGASKRFKPLKPIHTHLPSQAVNILKEVKTPQAKPESAPAGVKPVVLMSPTQLFQANVSSPTKRVGARETLRHVLRHKQRKQGNLWLARELGYKTEEDHLKDCQSAAKRKRELVRKIEQARVEANERKLLRDRIIRQDEGALEEEDGDEEGPKENSDKAQNDEEEDEEMQMARELEEAKETERASSDQPYVANDESPGITSGNATTESSSIPQSDEKESRFDGKDEEEDNSPGFSMGDGSQEESQQQWETQEPVQAKPKATVGKANAVPQIEDTVVEGATADRGSSDAAEAEDILEQKESSNARPGSGDEQSTGKKADNAFDESDDEGEVEFVDEQPKKDPNRPRNAAWQAMLQKEAERIKKQKRQKQGLVEDQAEEEEEEEVAGLEDFGFSIKKKKQDDDEDDIHDDQLDEDDLKHVVDDLSDDEGDEEAGVAARKKQERLEEKDHHKEIMRRMREGYDGRRGGIAGGGVGARGMHRFDQLVAADNREDAKRLGLLNDDELHSDDEDNDEKKEVDKNAEDNEDDEAALLDKMLKDRFLHRSDVNLEENFSEDDEEQDETQNKETGDDSEAEEERTQERLAKRFAKRARMQRLEEEYADSEEFSRQRLIDEDESMRQELTQMKVSPFNARNSRCDVLADPSNYILICRMG